MRRVPSELPFTGHSWDDNASPNAKNAEKDRQVTYHMGKAYLNESSIHVPKYDVTPDDLRNMRKRSAEEAENRQRQMVANFNALIRLGESLKALKGEV